MYLGAEESRGGHREVYPGVQGSEGNCEADDPEQTSRSGDRTECEYPPHTGVEGTTP